MRTRLFLAVLLVMSACSAIDANLETHGRQADSASPLPAPSPTPEPEPSLDEPEPAPPFAPAPRSRLPRNTDALAAKLEKVTGALHASIRKWRRSNEPRPPKVVVLQTLYQQRIYRLMAKRSELGNETLRRLDGMLARTSQDIVSAFRLLRSLVTPLKPGFVFKTGRFKPAAELLGFYKRAQRRFGVDWRVLAAVNYVETKFGRVKSTSTAGAQGPMQFLPSTWAAYGLGGNIKDDRDAIMGAANYLKSSGATDGPSGLRGALYAYNHSSAYVRAVLKLARDMKRRTRHYFAIYNWQVFVATTKGDKRLTGPGL
ncbi:MAG: lytic murein transglycosylase [Actinomycetota bacterium]